MNIFAVAVFTIILLIAYFLLREVNCWYWKINERNQKLDRICCQLEKLIEIQGEKNHSIKDINSTYENKQDFSIEKIKTRIEFPNGEIYNGEVYDGMPDGFGEMRYLNGETYQGTFSNGHPHGNGMLITSDVKYKVCYKYGRLLDKVQVND